MVREGNVRLDLSLPADLVHRCKGVLLDQGRAKKGGISEAISEALEAWLIANSPRLEASSKVPKDGIRLGVEHLCHDQCKEHRQ